MNPIPICLAIDDGCPINTYFYHDLGHRHEYLIPDNFAREFLTVCRKFDLRGKLSVVPMPLGLGRLDGEILHLPKVAHRRFLASVKELLPAFSITPELLTHYSVYNPTNDRLLHVFEDVWIDSHRAEEIADYTALALEILINVGLPPSGVSAPWQAGVANETEFLAGVGIAFKRTMRSERCFVRMFSKDSDPRSVLKIDNKISGKVIRVPANVIDPFWGTQYPATKQDAVRNAQAGIDAALGWDGRSGTIRELVEKGIPVVILTHWQSLFSEGRLTGLTALVELAERVRRVFGPGMEWQSMEELAWSR